MKTFKELDEARFVSSADFKLSSSGKKVHKMKKIADEPKDQDDGNDDDQTSKKITEAADQQEKRFMTLARLGLVDRSNISKMRIALDALKADKPLSMAQRGMLFSLLGDLMSLVTGDDAVFNRVRMNVQKESTEDLVEEELIEGDNKQMKGKDPCWKGYQMVGMKDKNGKKVPNCVPTEEKDVEEGYVSHAQRKAVWATRKDGGKGHPDKKKTVAERLMDLALEKHNGLTDQS
jgi:hypothetical protein